MNLKMNTMVTRPLAAVVTVAALAGLGLAGPAAAAGPGVSVAGRLAAGRAAVPPGTQLWGTRYAGPAKDNAAAAMAVSPDGTAVYVTGVSYGLGQRGDYLTVGYDAATGGQVWEARYNGPLSGLDAARSIAVSPDGTVLYVTGQSYAGKSRLLVTVAYSAATGAQLWVARYGGPAAGTDLPAQVAVSPDGATVYVAGTTPGTISGYDYATIAYSAATGARLWAKRYNGPGNGADYANALAVSPDGAAVYVTGSSPGTNSHDYYATIAYRAADGTRPWVARYAGSSGLANDAYAVAVSPDGATVYVSGGSLLSPCGCAWEWVPTAYSAATGALLWSSKKFNGIGAAPAHMTLSKDGSAIYLAGEDEVIAVSATGQFLWVVNFASVNIRRKVQLSVAVSPDGTTVYITGRADQNLSNSADYRTLACNAANGYQLWTASYNVPSTSAHYNEPVSVLVSPDGTRVFVTGTSSAAGKFYATVAYRG